MGTVGNLLKGKARMLVAPVGETRPDETSVGVTNSWPGNWVDVGFTKAPLAFNYEYDEHEFHVEQILGPVRRDRIGERAMFETVLSEITAMNYLRSAGGPTTGVNSVVNVVADAGQKGYDSFDLGNLPLVQELAVAFEGIRYDSTGAGQPLRVFFDKATLTLNGALEFSQKNDDHTGIPVQIKALANASTGRLFTMHVVTAPTTD